MEMDHSNKHAVAEWLQFFMDFSSSRKKNANWFLTLSTNKIFGEIKKEKITSRIKKNFILDRAHYSPQWTSYGVNYKMDKAALRKQNTVN